MLKDIIYYIYLCVVKNCHRSQLRNNTARSTGLLLLIIQLMRLLTLYQIVC